MSFSALKSRIEFCLLIVLELFPYYIKKILSIFGLYDDSKVYHGNAIRKKVDTSIVEVCIHEWGGYPLDRIKYFDDGRSINCGLKCQIERYLSYIAHGRVNLTVTMSDANLHKNIDFFKGIPVNLVLVDNIGMDFKGYSVFFNSISNKENCYVILSNTSIEATQSDFLKGYIDYMDNNLDVGMLGISYSTRMYHTLIRRNFVPHIQSFFILTTLDVLKSIVNHHGGKFPGADADYKRLLIRKGEIQLSRTVLELGYKLAVVHPETGIPFKFVEKEKWPTEVGELRYLVSCPNKLSPIK